MLRYILFSAVVVAAILGVVSGFGGGETTKNSATCSICVYVAELIDQALNEGKTEDEIVKIVDNACNLFPSALKDQCMAFINEYGPYVLKLIANQLAPLPSCTALKLCEK